VSAQIEAGRYALQANQTSIFSSSNILICSF
jgi:hypothetical protein